MPRIFATLSAVALGALPAAAQEVMDLDMITLFANQSGTGLDRSGATVDVLTEADLAENRATTLADYLATLPGVAISANGGPGGTTTLRVRGLTGAYVPVYVNGIEVTDPSATQAFFDWGGMSMGLVRRVEIVRGGSSAVNGSGAIGGVINVTAAEAPQTPGTEARAALEIGSNATRRAALSLGIAGERAGLAFGLARTATDGFSARSGDGFDEDDGFAGTQFSLDGYVDVTGDLRLGLSGYALDAEADFDEGPFAALPEDGRTETEARGLRAYAELRTGAVDHVLSATTYRIDRRSISNGDDDPFEGTRDTLDYVGTWETGRGVVLSFGADRTRETFEITELDFSAFPAVGRISTDEETTTTGLFAEALYAPRDDLDLSLSLRRDDHSEFGGFTSLRAAAAWRPAPDLTLRAVAASGFRAPSLYELYSTLYGNSDLDPETSRSYELGAEKRYASGAEVAATLFYNEIDDLILFAGGGYVQSDGTTDSRGVELTGSLPLGDRVTLSGAFTYTDSRDAAGDPQLRIPRYDAALALSARITERLTGGVTVQRVVDRPDEFGTEMPDYTLIDLSLGYAINDRYDAYLRVENAADEDYVTAAGYNTPDRSVFFGIDATF